MCLWIVPEKNLWQNMYNYWKVTFVQYLEVQETKLSKPQSKKISKQEVKTTNARWLLFKTIIQMNLYINFLNGDLQIRMNAGKS